MSATRWLIVTFVLAIGGALALAGTPTTTERADAKVAARLMPPRRDMPDENLNVVVRSELRGDVPAPRGLAEVLMPRRHTMRVGMEVLVDGRPLPTVSYRGRTYLPVPCLGAEYEIRVWNDGPRRVTAIVSVDGLSVLDSRPASEDRPGYVVEPFDSIRIKGWRHDRATEAAFRFVDRADSYAARLGHAENVGVIGLIVVEEMAGLPRPMLVKSVAGEPDLSRAAGDLGGMGTGYGRDMDSYLEEVPFVRGVNRMSVTLYYDTVAALRRAGVPVNSSEPMPFPGDLAVVPEKFLGP